MKKDKNIDELFREKLLNFEQEPPAYLLENIFAKTAAERRKKKIVLWRVAGVAAGLLLAFIAGWQINYLNNPMTGKSSETAKTEIQDVRTNDDVQDAENTGIQAHRKSLAFSNNKLGSIQAEERKSANTKAAKPQSIGFNEAVEKSVNEGSPVLKTIRRLEQRFKTKSYSTLALAEMKTSDARKELEALTIDQQIMKQNQEMLKAKKSENDKARWIVGALVSPEYSVSRSSHSKTYASNMLNIASSNPVDLGGGISVEVKTGKRWSLQSGVYYSALGQSSTNSSAASQKDYMFADASNGKNFFNTNVSLDPGTNKMLMNSSAGVIEFSGIPNGIEIGTNIEDKGLAPNVVVSEASFTQNFEYIEIPVYVRYTVIDSRFDVEMLGGFSSNVLVGNQTFMETASENSLIGKTRDMQSVNYSGTLGLGLKYGLSKRLFLNVEPRIKYYLNSLNNSASVTYKPYTFGVFSGLSYQF